MDFLVVMECLFVVLTSMILSLKKKKMSTKSRNNYNTEDKKIQRWIYYP